MLATASVTAKNDNISISTSNYEASKHNALKHGVLSKYTVMQWENREDYDSMLHSLINDYTPSNTTEEHLVEELAGIMWRKMRLKYAEMSSLQSSLSRNIGRDSFCSNDSAKEALLARSHEIENFDIKEAILSKENDNLEELKIAKECLECFLVAEKILEETNSYEDGLSALQVEDQNNWKNNYLGADEEDQPTYCNDGEDEVANEYYTASVEDLSHYINECKKHHEKRIYELENRSQVKQQILGKSFFYDKELDKYTRYENHLDKKFERTLAMLLKLKDLRGSKQS